MAGIFSRLLESFVGLALCLTMGCQGKAFYLPAVERHDSSWSQEGGSAAGRAFVDVELEPPLRLLWQQNIEASAQGGMRFTGKLALQLTNGPSLYVSSPNSLRNCSSQCCSFAFGFIISSPSDCSVVLLLVISSYMLMLTNPLVMGFYLIPTIFLASNPTPRRNRF